MCFAQTKPLDVLEAMVIARRTLSQLASTHATAVFRNILSQKRLVWIDRLQESLTFCAIFECFKLRLEGLHLRGQSLAHVAKLNQIIQLCFF
jgi:hypothetical protein